MAIDSALKRSSADSVLMSARGWVYPGTSGVSASERLAAGWMYSGISLAVAAVSVGSWIGKVGAAWLVLFREEEWL